VAAALDLVGGAPIVLDPVMVAESGARLLEEEAEDALRRLLVPRATVVTPNVPEAEVLAGRRAEGDLEALAREVHRLGPGGVVVTGGHREEAASDLFFDGSRIQTIEGERQPEGAAHGSGCTHSATLAVALARGADPLEAARRAKQVASDAIGNGLRELGSGAGPVDVLGLGGRAN
jgi:hydroxymethylpyrimidine/phosphomethylpyrimidine kinase